MFSNNFRKQYLYNKEENMTLLSRTAQLIRDLEKLHVIKRDRDYFDFKQTGKNMEIGISIDRNGNQKQKKTDYRTIESALNSEFQKDYEVKIDYNYDGDLICKIF